MHAFAAILLIILAAQACIFLFVCLMAHFPYRAKKNRYLIVCGARVRPDRTPSTALLYRLQAALEVYKKNLCEAIIVTGGQGADEPCTEASVMKQWLTEQGVNAESILSESTSDNTIKNLKNAKLLMDENASCAIVTSDYHLLRTLLLSRILKINASGFPAKSLSFSVKWLEGRIRETISWQILLIKLLLGKIG